MRRPEVGASKGGGEAATPSTICPSFFQMSLACGRLPVDSHVRYSSLLALTVITLLAVSRRWDSISPEPRDLLGDVLEEIRTEFGGTESKKNKKKRQAGMR